MTEPSTITYSIAEVLKDIDRKLEAIQKDVTDIKIEVTEVKTEVRNVKENVRDIKTVQNTLVNEVADLKGVKSLVIPIVVAVITAFLTLLARFIPNIFH
ncbi:MAG: shikimate dehydrogenase [Crocosphaera sp.]